MTALLDAPATAPPPLADLGADLTAPPSVARRALVLGRAFAWAALYAACATRGWWLAATACMVPLFLSAVVALNDTLHGPLRLPRWLDETAMFALGLLVMESGHAIRATHTFHHDARAGDFDPEAYIDPLPWPALLAESARYRYRRWAWAWRSGRVPRRWLVVEYALHAAVLGGTAIAGGPALRGFVVLGLLAGYACPLYSARGPHTAWGAADPLRVVVRGRVLPRLLLGLTYHQEHHRYPEVPSYRLPELARRLDPWLATRDVERVTVW